MIKRSEPFGSERAPINLVLANGIRPLAGCGEQLDELMLGFVIHGVDRGPESRVGECARGVATREGGIHGLFAETAMHPIQLGAFSIDPMVEIVNATDKASEKRSRIALQRTLGLPVSAQSFEIPDVHPYHRCHGHPVASDLEPPVPDGSSEGVQCLAE